MNGKHIVIVDKRLRHCAYCGENTEFENTMKPHGHTICIPCWNGFMGKHHKGRLPTFYGAILRAVEIKALEWLFYSKGHKKITLKYA